MAYHPNASHLFDLLMAIVDVLDDYERGIADWSEVEQALAEARYEVESNKEHL